MLTHATDAPPRMSLVSWLLLVVLSVCWAGSFFFVEVAVDSVPTFTIVFVRVALAALAMHLGFLIVGRRLNTSRELWRAYLGMAVLNNFVPFLLIVWGQSHISSALASILNATTPLFTIMVAHLATRDEKMTATAIVGAVIGFLGVVIIILPEVGGGDATVWGHVAVLGAAMSYAIGGVFGKRFARLGTRPTDAATGQLTLSALILLPLAMFVDQPWSLEIPGTEVVLALVGLALISTSLAYILYFKLLSTAGATNISLVTLLIPVSAILLGVFILDESLSQAQITGMAAIMVGLVIIDGRVVTAVAQKIQRPSS